MKKYKRFYRQQVLNRIASLLHHLLNAKRIHLVLLPVLITLNHSLNLLHAKLAKERYFNDEIPVYSDMEKLVKGYMNEMTLDDYIVTIAIGSEYSIGIAGTKIVNIGEGIYDIANEKPARGALWTMGWGKYKANVAIEGRPPKKMIDLR